MICVQHTFWCFVGWNDRILRIKELAFGRILTITENKDGILIVMTNGFSKHRQNSFILYFFFCNATTMHKHRQIGNTKKNWNFSPRTRTVRTAHSQRDILQLHGKSKLIELCVKRKNNSHFHVIRCLMFDMLVHFRNYI